jgi:DNA-binding NarL/FixJ family response regulator
MGLTGRQDKHQHPIGQDASSAIGVVIIEDQPDIREGLLALVNSAEGFVCLGGYGTMELALEAVPKLGERHQRERVAPPISTMVVLVDIGLPGMSGIEGIRILKQRVPRLSLMVLSVFEDDDRIFDAICAGASGYLLKKTPPDRLLDSLREVAAGGSPMSPEVARRVIDHFRGLRPTSTDPFELTPQEKRVLKLLVEGHNYKTAADELDVTINTISFHVRHIYEKLQVHSKTAAVVKAIKNRLV